MAEEKEQQVESVDTVKGKIKWFGPPANPLPVWMARLGKALRYICTGAIVSVSGAPTDVMTAHQATVWSFWLGLFIIASGGLELMVGIEPTK